MPKEPGYLLCIQIFFKSRHSYIAGLLQTFNRPVDTALPSESYQALLKACMGLHDAGRKGVHQQEPFPWPGHLAVPGYDILRLSCNCPDVKSLQLVVIIWFRSWLRKQPAVFTVPC